MSANSHTFHAVALVENLSLRDLAPLFPKAKRSPQHLQYTPEGVTNGEAFVFPFGALVFRNMTAEQRGMEIERLVRARPGLSTTPVANEELVVREEPGAKPAVAEGALVVDALTSDRTGVVALLIAQSAAMEYYERAVEEMFGQTARWVERLETRGTVSMRLRPLHQFIGRAIGTRSEVLSVLHLLDKPDEAWDDPVIDQIYDQLRAELVLEDRYQSLELKLRSVQEALELIVDVARDRRLVLLEAAIVLLIVLEVVMALVRG